MERETYIQKYLSQQLSKDELIAFAKKREIDKEFDEEVKLLSNLYVVSKKEELNHIKDILLEAKNEGLILKSKKNDRINRNRKVYLITLLVLLIGILLLTFFKKESKSDTLFASYYKTPSNSYYPLVRDSKSNNLDIKNAFTAYEQKDYQKANQLLSIISEYDQVPEIQFYHAITLLELGDIQVAQSKIEAIKTQDPFLLNEMQWYQALIALKLGNVEKAKTILDVKDINQKSQKWKQLLEDL